MLKEKIEEILGPEGYIGAKTDSFYINFPLDMEENKCQNYL